MDQTSPQQRFRGELTWTAKAFVPVGLSDADSVFARRIQADVRRMLAPLAGKSRPALAPELGLVADAPRSVLARRRLARIRFDLARLPGVP